MRKWLVSAALASASVGCLVVAVTKYAATFGDYGAYVDDRGHMTVPGLPDPAPWFGAGFALLALSAAAVFVTWRRSSATHRRDR